MITLGDGSRTSFLGSVNETLSGWRINYELLWEDPSPEAIEWVQEEFDALGVAQRPCPWPISSSKTLVGCPAAA